MSNKQSLKGIKSKFRNKPSEIGSAFGNAEAIFGEDQDDKLHPQIIKMARKSGQLNLSNKGLTKVPDKIFHINQLDEQEQLAIAKSIKIDQTDEDKWWEQVDLSKLFLNSNAISHINPLISKLSSLQVLDVSDNNLLEVPSSIGELSNLSKLNLSRNHIENLPSSIGNLADLRHLNLAQNKLKNLPDMGNLFVLEHLDLSHNRLEYLPANIGYLQRLTKLCVSNNTLQYIPLEIGDLFALLYLDLSHNQITILPESLGKLPKLVELYARKNKINHFPKLQCANLRELYLGINQIKGFSNKDIEDIKGLQVLDLSDNRIEELPESITILQYLHRLDISNNYLSNLPAHLGHLQHLQTITLDGNPLNLIRRDIIQRGTSQLLKYLASKANKSITSYPGFESSTQILYSEKDVTIPDKYEMKSTKVLIFNQKAGSIPEEVFENAHFAQVKTTDLSHNKLNFLPDKISLLADNLMDMILSHNRITTLPNIFAEFKVLQYLNVQNNLLSDLPMELGQLSNLREVNISFNKFTELPACVFIIPQLEILFAGDNKIGEIPVKDLMSITRLATLDLHNNDISFVPPELGKMTQLSTVMLEGNRFRVPRNTILAKGTRELLEYLRSRIVEPT